MTARTASTPLHRPAAVPQMSDDDLCINTIRTLAIDAVQNKLKSLDNSFAEQVLSALRKGFDVHIEPDKAAQP